MIFNVKSNFPIPSAHVDPGHFVDEIFEILANINFLKPSFVVSWLSNPGESWSRNKSPNVSWFIIRNGISDDFWKISGSRVKRLSDKQTEHDKTNKKNA